MKLVLLALTTVARFVAIAVRFVAAALTKAIAGLLGRAIFISIAITFIGGGRFEDAFFEALKTLTI